MDLHCFIARDYTKTTLSLPLCEYWKHVTLYGAPRQQGLPLRPQRILLTSYLEDCSPLYARLRYWIDLVGYSTFAKSPATSET